jgi:hypothetical protein
MLSEFSGDNARIVPLNRQKEREMLDKKILEKINVGDRIKFNSPTREARSPAVRIVTGRDSYGRLTVRYHGYGDFIVYDHEIIKHIPKWWQPNSWRYYV